MLVTTILQFSQLAILARFLTPEQFGLMALVTVVIGFSQAFVDMGMSNAIIHKQTNCQLHLSTLFWLTILAGICITGLVFISASWVTNFYEAPELQPLIQLVSLAFVISALGSQYKVLFQKELQFKVIAIVELCSVCCAFIVAISMAVLNFGVYALVVANITMTLVSSMLFFILGTRSIYVPKFHFRWHEARGYVGFGAYQMGERTINYFSANIDKILIGKFLGVGDAGIYNLAWQLINFPLRKINPMVNKVAMPIYGRVQQDNKLIDTYYCLTMIIISMMVAPFTVYLSFFSELVVEVVYGNDWISASPVVSILAVVGLVRALGNPGGGLLIALGYAKVCFWWNVVWGGALICAMYITLVYFPDIKTAPLTFLFLSVVFAIIWHVLMHKIAGVTYGSLIKRLLGIVMISIAACLFANEVVSLFEGFYPSILLVISLLACSLIYIPYLFVFERNVLANLKSGKVEN